MVNETNQVAFELAAVTIGIIILFNIVSDLASLVTGATSAVLGLFVFILAALSALSAMTILFIKTRKS